MCETISKFQTKNKTSRYVICKCKPNQPYKFQMTLPSKTYWIFSPKKQISESKNLKLSTKSYFIVGNEQWRKFFKAKKILLVCHNENTDGWLVVTSNIFWFNFETEFVQLFESTSQHSSLDHSWAVIYFKRGMVSKLCCNL